MKNKNRIGPEILAAHDRVSGAYGIVTPDGLVDSKSYSAWNFMRNVKQPLTGLLSGVDRGARILDAGCGNGQISQLLAGMGFEQIVGLDFSEMMLQQAIKRARNFNYFNRCSFILDDTQELSSLKNESFDVTLLFGVIEHLDYPDRAIRNLIRVTRKGGFFVLGVPRKFSLAFFSYVLAGISPSRWGKVTTWKDYFNYSEKLNYYRFFSPFQIKNFLANCEQNSVVERLGFAYLHLDGAPGYLWNRIGSRGESGFSMLDSIDSICKKTGLIPAGEYWLIRRHG